MKLRLLLCAALFLQLTTYAQQPFSLDKRVSVSMPAETTPTNSGGNPVWAFSMNDAATISGMAIVVDGRKYELDSATIAANYNDAEFLQSLVNGFFGQVASVKEVAKKKIAGKGFKGYEIQLENTELTEDYPYRDMYIRVNFVGHTVYALGVFSTGDVDATAERQAFFNSFKVK